MEQHDISLGVECGYNGVVDLALQIWEELYKNHDMIWGDIVRHTPTWWFIPRSSFLWVSSPQIFQWTLPPLIPFITRVEPTY